MTEQRKDIAVFILAKNESRNIGRCLQALANSGWKVVVLDSGSTDETPDITSNFGFAEFRKYRYIDHCAAYNDITRELATDHKHVVILDSDMVVSTALQREIATVAGSGAAEVIEAQILMCVDGEPLQYGSLCPPKPFVFATGKEYFISVGHGEKLLANLNVMRAKEKLRHDDRKFYAEYLQSQFRYAKNLANRRDAKQISSRDWLRTKTPFLIFIVPFVSYVLKGGFMSGKAGALYALDRLIAEAIMYRQALSRKSESS